MPFEEFEEDHRDRLATASAYDLRRLAETLAQAGAGSALADLVRHARASRDAEIREVSEDFGDPPAG